MENYWSKLKSIGAAEVRNQMGELVGLLTLSDTRANGRRKIENAEDEKEKEGKEKEEE